MAGIELYPGMVRATVPLYGTHFQGLNEGRTFVGHRVVLASLDDTERRRLLNQEGREAYYRLEFFSMLPDFTGFDLPNLPSAKERFIYDHKNESIGETIDAHVTLLCLCARLHPNHSAILADVWTGKFWNRLSLLKWNYSTKSNPHDYSCFPFERVVKTWAQLCALWPENPTKQLKIALSYYADSIWERQHRSPDKAFLSAAMGLEILVGYRSSSEISKTVSRRAAHLVGRGSEALLVYETARNLYNIRSKLVHDGVIPREAHVHMMQQLLMAVIPAVMAAHPLIKHEDLMKELDAADFGDSELIKRVNDPLAWWQYVDFPNFLGKLKK